MNENNYNYYNPNTQQQQTYQQPVYQQPVYYAQPEDKTKEVMSVGEYIGMTILLAIPVVNIICWIIWLTSPNTNKNKKNYLIAQLVIMLIGVALSIGAFILFSIAGISLLDELQYMI